MFCTKELCSTKGFSFVSLKDTLLVPIWFFLVGPYIYIRVFLVYAFLLYTGDTRRRRWCPSKHGFFYSTDIFPLKSL